MVGAQGELGERVADRDLSFRVVRALCGIEIGDEDSEVSAPGHYCGVSFEVLNHGGRARSLNVSPHRLHTESRSGRPWPEGMKAIVLDDAGSLFGRSIPPGGGGLATVLFSTRRQSIPRAVVLHQSRDSDGATVLLPACRFGCSVSGSERASPGMAYGFALDITTDLDDSSICFDRRDWQPIQPVSRSSQTNHLFGQGIIGLAAPNRALFTDNSGVTVRLQPSIANHEDPAICG